MTMQVSRRLGHRLCSDSGDFFSVERTGPVLCASSGGNPCMRPSARPASLRPASARRRGGWRGTDAEAEAMSWAGRVLVAASEQHDRVHGLGGDHFLGCHGHEVAVEHGGGGEEDFAEGKGSERRGGRPPASNTPRLTASTSLGHGAMAGGVVGRGIGDADDGPRSKSASS